MSFPSSVCRIATQRWSAPHQRRPFIAFILRCSPARSPSSTAGVGCRLVSIAQTAAEKRIDDAVPCRWHVKQAREQTAGSHACPGGRTGG